MPEETKKKKKKKKVVEHKRIRQVVEELTVPVQTVPLAMPTPGVEHPHVQTTPTVSHTHPKPEPEEKVNFLKLLLLTMVTAFIVAVISGSLYVYFSGISKIKEVPTETPSSTLPPITPTTTPQPSPTATPNPKAYKLSVLNGSGKIGAAGTAKTLLEKAGFKVSSTANAASFDFSATQIQTKTTVDAATVDLLKETLSQSYKVALGDTLPSSASQDIVITVGSTSD